jgi:hypothetical protein
MQSTFCSVVLSNILSSLTGVQMHSQRPLRPALSRPPVHPRMPGRDMRAFQAACLTVPVTGPIAINVANCVAR